MGYNLLGLMASVVLGSGHAPVAELNALTDLRVTPTQEGARVVVHGSRGATFTAFRLDNPERVIVDLANADPTAIKGNYDGVGPISKIAASQFTDGQASLGRVLLSVSSGAQYSVRGEKNDVVIDVSDAKPANATPPVHDANVESARAPEGKLAAPAYPENVIAAETDEQRVSRPARTLTAIVAGKNELRIVTDGQVAKYQIIQLVAPPRLALEVYHVKSTAKTPVLQNAYVKAVRIGSHPDRVRVVIESSAPDFPAYELKRAKNGLRVQFHPKAPDPTPAAPVAVSSSPAEAARSESENQRPEMELDGKKIDLEATEMASLPIKNPPEKKNREDAVPSEILDIRFDENGNGGQIQIKATRPLQWKTERIDAQSVSLILENAKLPKKLERTLDTSALKTPIRTISSFSVPASQAVRIVATANTDLSETSEKSKHGVRWSLNAVAPTPEAVAVQAQTAAEGGNNPTFVQEGGRRRSRYTGKRMTFEFKDIDIHNFLRVIADISKKNIVVGDDVKGSVTIRLRNVPWDQALDIVLRTRSLGKEDLGNVLRIAPLKTLEEEAKLRAERAKAARILEPLHVQLIPVNYAKADDLSARVKEVLSERGTASVDQRTNVLIVKDIEANLGKARSLVQSLDLQTPQVMIESRIVEANTTFSRQIGVQWGGSASLSPATGNPTGLVFPYSAGVRGGIAGSAPGLVDNPNFAVNLPAGVGQGAGGALGFTFGSAGGAVALNLRLSAAEAQGTVKTISAPKVTTMDNVSATISQGVSIPFSQSSAAGVNTTFVEARLSLTVTPHITQDGSVMMVIAAQNNQPDPANSGSNGQPGIQRKEATTTVLVKDSDTTVIGGIYVRRGSNATSEVPFFSKIPLLGFFFRFASENDNRQELLIFITPHIINRQTMPQTL